MKKAVLIFVLLCCTAITYSQISGDITRDTTWSGTVTVSGDVNVKEGATLSIKSGTQVLFQNYDKLIIEGTILAIGTGDSMILFSPEDSTGWSNFNDTTGGWQGVRVKSIPDEMNIFQNCKFQYGKALDTPQSEHWGGAMRIYWIDNVLVDSCFFYMNYAEYGGGAIACHSSDMTIKHSTFYGNIAKVNSGAIQISDGSPVVDACLIANNKSEGGGSAIQLVQTESVLTNNIIVNNETTGGGCIVMGEGCFPLFLNNTICNNLGSEVGGFLLYDQAYPVFINNIIYGNRDNDGASQFNFEGKTPEPTFMYNNIQGGFNGFDFEPGTSFSGVYENNSDIAPDFASATTVAGLGQDGSAKTWKLNMDSPGINAGLNNAGNVVNETDYEGNVRIRYSIVDQGAREYYNEGYELQGIINDDLFITADTINVTGDVTINDTYTLGINPGAYVRFMGYFKIEVKGTLQTLGAESDYIVFTRNDTSGFSDLYTDTGGWGGVSFWYTNATNDSSRFLYTKFEYGKAVNSNTNGGAIRIASYNKVLVDHCVFENNVAVVGGAVRAWTSPIHIKNSVFRFNTARNLGGAIDCLLSNTLIENCLIENNIARGDGGGGIRLSRGRSTLLNNTIRHNVSLKHGGGIYSYDLFPEISGNSITYNTAGVNGGGIHFGNTAYISKNFIANNSANRNGGGIYGWVGKNSVLTNNIIVNNTSRGGGGLYLTEEVSDFINNTVAFNYSESQGGGIYLSENNLNIYNSIIWGNKAYYGSPQVQISTGSNPSIFYSNIQGGRDEIEGVGKGELAEYVNNIDSLPEFMVPTDSAGAEFDGTAAYWGLKATSPCINRGTQTMGDIEVPETDIMDKPRIHFDTIDMGAVENQGIIPQVTLQPFSKYKCEGTQVELNVMASDTVHYQWQLDGTDIPGARFRSLTIDSITLAHQGAYTCKMWNSYGRLESNPALLITILPPSIWQQPSGGWVKSNDLTVLSFGHHGTEPLNYQWYKNGELVEGASIPELRFQHTGYTDEGIYSCIVSNSCGTTETDEIILYVAPEICMVTVDLSTGNNLVVWEKKSEAAPITHYNVYRESVSAGIFDPIGTVPYDDLSVFLDSVANPTSQSYQYKITATDTSDNETDSDLCPPHKTIHLLTTTNPETRATQLDWDFYYGFDYGTFNIYRSSTGKDFSSFHMMASSSTTYTDNNPDQDLFYYRIGVIKLDPCIPSSKFKVDDEPYSQSLSNVENNMVPTTDVDKLSDFGGMIISPNPFSESTTIRFTRPDKKSYRLNIIDLSGKVVLSTEVNDQEYVLYRNNLESGYYIIELHSDNLYRGKLIIE